MEDVITSFPGIKLGSLCSFDYHLGILLNLEKKIQLALNLSDDKTKIIPLIESDVILLRFHKNHYPLGLLENFIESFYKNQGFRIQKTGKGIFSITQDHERHIIKLEHLKKEKIYEVIISESRTSQYVH
jgi:hypothetical protein